MVTPDSSCLESIVRVALEVAVDYGGEGLEVSIYGYGPESKFPSRISLHYFDRYT